MPSLQGHKFINRERPRSQKPDNGLAYFASSGQAPQPVQRELLPMLLSRGFEESRPLLLDTRQWHELNPLLKRAESRPRSTTDPPAAALRRSLSAAGSLERVGTMQRAGSKQLGSRKSLYGETGAGGGAGGASDAAIDERVRQKLGQRAKAMQRRARAMRERADSHGIFDPAVNRLRASSACLCELHRSASAEGLREVRSAARQELVLGLPFEDEAALKVATTRASTSTPPSP